ncbi:MAG TPA: ESPR domain-containing protein, partial [Hydrogenophaga sp.]
MNAVYKSIWNESLGTYVAAAESAAPSGRRTSSVRQARRQPMRGGAQPMALEQRIVFDGALLATAGEVQLDAGDADVGVVDDVSTASPVELIDEAPAAASPTPAPSVAEEADASVPEDTDTSADGSVDANESQNEPSAGGASDPVDAVGETGSLTGADAEVEATMTLDAGGDGSGAVQTASGSDAAGLEGGGADAGLASPQLDDATLEATGD